MRRDPLAGHPLGLGYLFASHPIFEDVLVPPDAPAPGTADGSTSNIGSGATLGGTSGLFHLDLPTLPVWSDNERRMSPRIQAASFLEEE